MISVGLLWITIALAAAGELASWIARLVRRARCRATARDDAGKTIACAARGGHDPELFELARVLAAGCADRVAMITERAPRAVVGAVAHRAGDLLLVRSPAPAVDGPLYDDEIRRIVRGAGCAVAIYFRRSEPELRRLVIPVHGAPDDELAIALAARVQAATGCAIVVVSAIRRERFARELLAAAGGTARIELVSTPTEGPAERALSCAREHDLVLVGAGRKGESNPGQLGFFRDRLVRQTSASVLLLMVGDRTADTAVARIDGDPRGAGSPALS